jgi:hypothetical protein
MSVQEIKEERPTKGMYRRAAQLFRAKDGSLEVDDNAEVSLGDDEGAYVQCWCWVEDELVAKAFSGGKP